MIEKKKDSFYKQFLFSVSEDAFAGGCAGLIARTLTAPFDVVKIRYQLLCAEVTTTPSLYHAFEKIVKEEGILALWKGNISATYLWISYAVVQFGVYGMFKDYIEAREKDQIEGKSRRQGPFSLMTKAGFMYLSGVAAGTAATALTYPFDIMRTQFAVQGKTKVYNSMAQFIRQTYQTRGIAGFYAGLGPAIIGITPYVGLNFSLYETLKTLTERFNDPNNPVGAVIRKGALGGIAGGTAKFLLYPLDTVKKRLQAQTLEFSGSALFRRTKYRGMFDCFSTIFREEGVKGFYRGMVPTMAKTVTASTITFMSFEGAKEIIRLQKNIFKHDDY